MQSKSILSSKKRVILTEGVECESSPLKIQVYTSARNRYSGLAVEQVMFIAKKLQSRYDLKVVESSVDDNPSLMERSGIIALPLTVIGNYSFVGIPDCRDLERIIHHMHGSYA
ncbi:MAG: hypothetical protein ACFFEF_14995 [Candidatus Thorarchaeota archaeon]